MSCKYLLETLFASEFKSWREDSHASLRNVLPHLLGCSDADFDVHIGGLSQRVARWCGAGGRR